MSDTIGSRARSKHSKTGKLRSLFRASRRHKHAKPKKHPVLRWIGVLTSVLLVLSIAVCVVVGIRTLRDPEADLFGYRLFYVSTGSMEPTVPIGSLILTGECEQYKVGDIITFRSRDAALSGAYNTHKIVQVTYQEGKVTYRTKGDAAPAADPLPVPHGDVVGKLYFMVDGQQIKNLTEFLGTKQGFFVMIVAPLLLVLLLMMREMKNAMKRDLERRQAVVASISEKGVNARDDAQDSHQTR